MRRNNKIPLLGGLKQWRPLEKT